MFLHQLSLKSVEERCENTAECCLKYKTKQNKTKQTSKKKKKAKQKKHRVGLNGSKRGSKPCERSKNIFGNHCSIAFILDCSVRLGNRLSSVTGVTVYHVSDNDWVQLWSINTLIKLSLLSHALISLLFRTIWTPGTGYCYKVQNDHRAHW